MKIGEIGIIKWGDGKESKVRIIDIESYSFMPTDYWLEYLESESYRPLVHPDLGISEDIKSSILLPEGLMNMVYKVLSNE